MLIDAWDQYLRPTPPSAAHARVLIVDDEPAICEIVDRILRHGGYETEIAYSGAVALARAEAAGPFDLLLTDVKMPDVSGDALAAQVRRFAPEIKVLYLTGYSDQLFNDKGTLWEGEAFVDKPASGRGLLEAVALLLTGHVRA